MEAVCGKELRSDLLQSVERVRDGDKRELLDVMLEFMFDTVSFIRELSSDIFRMEQELDDEMAQLCVFDRTAIAGVFVLSPDECVTIRKALIDPDPAIPEAVLKRVVSPLYKKAAYYLWYFIMHCCYAKYPHEQRMIRNYMNNAYLGHRNIVNYWEKMSIVNDRDQDPEQEALDAIKTKTLLHCIKNELLPSWRKVLEDYKAACFDAVMQSRKLKDLFVTVDKSVSDSNFEDTESMHTYLNWIDNMLKKFILDSKTDLHVTESDLCSPMPLTLAELKKFSEEKHITDQLEKLRVV